MNSLYTSIIQLSKYKVFLGHSIYNANIMSAWLIFNIRGKLTTLNLYHTLKMLKLSYNLIKLVINKGLPFWFINFDLTKEDIIRRSAHNTGEFHVTRRWIRGLVSNYFCITKVYRDYLIKKEFVDSNRVRDIFDKWFFTRFTWPRALFISNERNSNIFYKETFKSKIPTVGLVDLNIKSYIYNIPIGCNDDSLESLTLMHTIMSQYILKCKYKKVLIWYYFSRNIKKYKTLVDWLNVFIKKKKKIKNKMNIKYIKMSFFINEYLSFRNSFGFFVGRSYTFKLFPKKDLKENNRSFFDQFYNFNKNFIYNKFKVLNYKNLSYKYRLKYKRRVKLNKISGLISIKSFLNNYIKLINPFSYARRYKRIKRKNRIKMERKRVSKNFKSFFYFIFFFYLNKFNLVLDTYNKQNFNLHNIVSFAKFSEKRRYKQFFKNKEKNMSLNKFRLSYIFRYKNKTLYNKKKKSKYTHFFDGFNRINEGKHINMAFLFFYWKFLIIFLGLKIRLPYKNFYLKSRKYGRIK